MKSIGKLSGENGCYLQVGSGTYTPAGRHVGKKIYAVGVYATANITNFKHTPLINGRASSQVTETGDGWQGISLAVADGAVLFIPLGKDADEVTIASGSVFMYFK